MSKDYSTNKATAKRLIEKYGQALNFISKSDSSDEFDEYGEPLIAAPDTIVEGFGIKFDYKIKEIDNKNIIVGDAKLLISTEGEIVAGMQVSIGSEVWRVIEPNPLQPTDVVIFYEAQVRR